VARDDYRFLLRLPQELRELLADAAAESGRSLNAEIVHRLGDSLTPAPAAPTPVPAQASRWRPALVAATAAAVLAAAVGGGAAIGREVGSAGSGTAKPVVADGKPLLPRLYPWATERPDIAGQQTPAQQH
jgi:hypothetical protein